MEQASFDHSVVRQVRERPSNIFTVVFDLSAVFFPSEFGTPNECIESYKAGRRAVHSY